MNPVKDPLQMVVVGKILLGLVIMSFIIPRKAARLYHEGQPSVPTISLVFYHNC